jgi:hypothetical protein
MPKPATTNKPVEPKRDRHGFRGVPPPVTFDFDALADGALLSETDVAAILRMSTNTVASWRQRPDHPLRFLVLPNGFIRYTAGHIREFLASGKPRPPRGTPPATKPKPPRRKPKPSGTPTATTKIHTEDATSERRRAPRRPRTAEAAAPAEAE